MNLIPRPLKFESKPGYFRILPKSRIMLFPFNPRFKEMVEIFAEKLRVVSGYKLPVIPGTNQSPTDIVIEISTTGLGKEGYLFNSNARYLKIAAETEAGIFNGLQTLNQLLPLEIENKKLTEIEWTVPVCKIEDKPRFGWRGMHLDVSRHFFDADFIKHYIDLLAFHKMNVFHWHLTDDNGWRIEIKKYPELQKISAWRADRTGIDWHDCKPQQAGEECNYGGYYTQEEVKEIINYASLRNITVVPEIEMPGHASEVLAAYPELGCSGGPYRVATGVYWPNKDIFCAGEEKVFTFLENVLEEVIELFPSEYIHIGGDEATKTEWKKCPKCQQRMKDEKLKDELELQSWFIKRMEKFLLSKNRKLIGWDEILEGGLAPNAAVMSWRGEDGGIKAAKAGHDVVMTPGTHCYFDHYQGDSTAEEKAIGGYTTLKKVFNYEPIPATLTQKETKHILGAQGNVWTEWIQTPERVEYMILPRMSALAESIWSPAATRNWPNFHDRIQFLFKRFDKWNVNYSRGTFRIEINTDFDKTSNIFTAQLSSEQYKKDIYYTLDGSTPNTSSTIYTEPIEVTKTTVIRAAIIEDGKIRGNYSEKIINFHKALGKPVTLFHNCSPKFAAISALTDGLLGSTSHNDGCWMATLRNHLEAVIDLGKVENLSKISIRCLHNPAAWIFLPKKVDFLGSVDGINFFNIGIDTHNVPTLEKSVTINEFKTDFKAEYRYLKVVATSQSLCPQGHVAEGDYCWLFTDEIVIL